MAEQHVEQSSAKGRRLFPLFILIFLAALAVRSVVVQLPAQASPLPLTPDVRRAQTQGAVGEAYTDNGPGMDEAAVAKCPER